MRPGYRHRVKWLQLLGLKPQKEKVTEWWKSGLSCLLILGLGTFHMTYGLTRQNDDYNTDSRWNYRKLLANETEHELPVWEQCTFETGTSSGAWVFSHAVCVIIIFIALAIICDDFFVPSLEIISEKLNLSEDVAGATFMAAGSSAPELFSSVAGVAVESDVGVGTIVGSAVFNLLIIIALTAALAGQILHLDWRPLLRDTFFYAMSIGCFIGFSWDGYFMHYEAVVLLILYTLYIILMVFNPRLMDWLGTLQCCGSKVNPSDEEDVKDEEEGGKVKDTEDHRPSLTGGHARRLSLHKASLIELHPDSHRHFHHHRGSVAGVLMLQQPHHPLRHNRRDSGFQSRENIQLSQSATGDKGKSSHQMELQNIDVEQGINLDDHSTDYDILPAITVTKQNKVLVQGSGEVTSTAKSGAHGKMPVTNSGPKSPLTPTLPSIQSEDDLEIYEERKSHHVGNGESATGTMSFFPNSKNTSAHHLTTLKESDQSDNGSGDEKTHSACVSNLSNLPQNNVANGNAGKVSTETETKNGKVNGETKKAAAEDTKSEADSKSNGSNSDDEDETMSICPCIPCIPLIRTHPPSAAQAKEEGGCWNWIKVILRWVLFIPAFPFVVLFSWTVPDCSKDHLKKYFLVSFFMSVFWIAVLSFGMVTLVVRVGCILSIDTYIMGLVIVAVGTSIPDALSSILVARDGYGDMAVSNAIGSNVFDINLGIGLPFIIRIAIDRGKPISLLDDEEWSDLLTGHLTIIPHAKFGFILLLLLIIALSIFLIAKFRLNKWIGISFVTMYAMFLAYAFIQELYCARQLDTYC